MAPANLQLRKFDPFRMPQELVRRLAVGCEGVLRDMHRVVGENLATIGAPPQHLCLVAARHRQDVRAPPARPRTG